MEGEELVGSDLHIILDDTSVHLTHQSSLLLVTGLLSEVLKVTRINVYPSIFSL